LDQAIFVSPDEAGTNRQCCSNYSQNRFKVLGIRFIFDQHDPFPEFFEARFQQRGFLYRLIRLAERMTFRTADVTIVTNDSCREIAITRGECHQSGVSLCEPAQAGMTSRGNRRTPSLSKDESI
jgi:hypothetical protein